ncbi:unnamed protein product [Arabidopsis lyrata]|uniref:Uncharacterized protein n=1 Tax=Arabidopsis lyrata subsp. lyrata TaxID=81972 RepID=D7L6X5_ARALL|nr:uncharacterized protein LOC9322093 [Arabidopsis lyrata subsp. lyrata]EFH60234.1 hypothetical protein ARALYDRAFT_899908 [Arabidopsis lyrata subsp. lyrata]CAH8262770.1 unnamed protein product [Arabidopsis lyrata]|eukprot:XP_002883975.1 uncharacterized protein LOC9322093 [Arabidopsis lyrata subsp. lyrata]
MATYDDGKMWSKLYALADVAAMLYDDETSAMYPKLFEFEDLMTMKFDEEVEERAKMETTSSVVTQNLSEASTSLSLLDIGADPVTQNPQNPTSSSTLLVDEIKAEAEMMETEDDSPNPSFKSSSITE